MGPGSWYPGAGPMQSAAPADGSAILFDPLTAPLPPAPPPTWKAREDRVAWCRENLTVGERALLVKLSYDVDNAKRADCDAIIAKEKKACAG